MASSSSSVSWMPAPGRHAINIGPSLGKALKARKLKGSPAATGTTKRSNLPERDFYSFRFNFKPPSIDTTKPASIEIQKSADNTKVLVEYPSAQSGEAHIFLGAEQSAKEVDCVLIYDEDTGTYSLEKLDSFVNLHYDRKTTVSPRPSPTPKAPPSTQKTTKGKGKRPQVIDDLESELLGLDADAEGDIDIGMEVAVTKPVAREEEEEEEEGEVVSPPKPPSPVPPKVQPPQPPKTRPVKPIPKPRVEAKAPVASSQPSRQKPTSPAPPPNALPTVPVPPISAPPRPKPRPVPKKEQVHQKEPIQQKERVKQAGSIPKKASVQKTESIQKKEPIQKKKPRPVLPPTANAPPKSASYADEEIIEISRPTKRPRPSTPQQPLLPPTSPAAVTLSLPGGSNSFAPPPPPLGSHNARGTGSTSRNIPLPIVPPPTAVALSLPTSIPASPSGQYESEDEEWDEVSTANIASASLPNSNNDDNAAAYALELDELEQAIFGDVLEEVDGDYEGQAQPHVDGDGEEEEIDMNAFEQELNEHMEVAEDSDDDVFGGLVESEPDVQGGTRQPISMNRLASGGVGAESEEDYSSSEDSDDE